MTAPPIFPEKPRRRSQFNGLRKLARPQHYVKNGFVLLPAFFALSVQDMQLAIQLILAFVAFCAAASGVYIFNDWRDIHADRQHPTKRFRPLASGIVPVRMALVALGVFWSSALLAAYFSQPTVCTIVSSYILLNIAYSLGLKQISLLDVCIVASGFVLRLVAGAYATQTMLSAWIILMTFLLCLFLALGKRRDDVLLLQRDGVKSRKAIDGYNLPFLNGVMVMMAAVVIVAYVMYTTSPEVASRWGAAPLFYTTAFVILGILRYLQIVFVEENSGNPTHIALKDRFIVVVLLAWLGTFAWILH